MAPAVEVLTPSDPTSSYYSSGLREKYRLDQHKVPAPEKPGQYSDLKYAPDEAKYLARSAARVAAGGLEKEVPAGWPKVLKGPMAWTTTDFPDESKFVHQLTEAEKAEIVKALEYFKEQGLDGDEVTRENFPLPTLSVHLEKACHDIYEGRGFVIIRGLDPDAFSAEDLAIVYLGVSSYIAPSRGKQDQRGSMIMHVLNREDSADPADRPKWQPFHTDTVCDVLGLLTRSCSAQGGRSILASAWTIYNELAATRPDLLHVLAASDWPFDTYGRTPPYYTRPLLYHTADDKVILNFSRRLLTGHPREGRTPGIPGLTEAQAEALDACHFIGRKHEIRTTMQRGDMRFINNMSILHCREDFTDDVAQGVKRHLVRLWLSNEEMLWKLPEELRLAWARVFYDQERGEHWDFEPPRKNGVILRTATSCD